MAHFRLFLVLAAIAALGYVAYQQGWVTRFAGMATPTPEPTLGFTVHRTKRSRHIFHGNEGFPGPLAGHSRRQHGIPASAPTPNASSTNLAALHNPGSNSLEIPSAACAPAVPAVGPKLPFPRNFEGCWQAHMTQPRFVVLRPRACSAGHFPDRLCAVLSLCRQFARYHFFEQRGVPGGFRLGGIEGRRREKPNQRVVFRS